MDALLGSLVGSKKSHPKKLLIDHLRNVTEFAKKLAANQGLQVDNNLLSAITLTHDIGKAHPKFQKMLDGKGSGVKHAKPSAWFTLSITDSIWAAEIVCRHHTNLRNLDDMIADWANDYSFNEVMNKLLPNWPYMLNEDMFYDMQEYFYFHIKDELSIEKWLAVRLLYSLLISADRMEAIGIESISDEKIPGFIKPVLPGHSTEIDTWREQIKNICLQRAKDISEPGVYTLTLPTGAGKTLTGLAIADEWAKRFKCKTIIYGLPFISIVEQTASVAKSVFGNQYVQEDHSLVYGKENEEGKYSQETSAWEKMSTLFRYWREPVILTTLVHFWDALFSPNANQTMNFHRLSNAVVILDEPQTISPRYWQGFGKVLSYISRKWNTFFLLMTATQPHIVNNNEEIAPPNTFFPYNRHHYQALMDKKIKIGEISDVLLANLPVHNNSGLVVMNRKIAALQVYRALEKLNLQAPILLLSGWLTPLRRRIILRYLKWLEKKGRRRYLVATQVIEAGVDLDFDWVFRDLGPMDSIIQVGGRCNRHSRKGILGKVLIAEITNENGYPLWSNVYDKILIEKTKEVLESEPSFNEDSVRNVVSEYYKKILEGLTSIPIYESLSQGYWGEYTKLIDEKNYDSITVFVEEDSKLLPMLKRLEESEWTLENKDEQKKLIRKVMQYAIEIPANLISACRTYCANIPTKDDEPVFRPVFGENSWLLRKEAIKKNGLYEPILGFIPPEEDLNNVI